MSLEGLTIALRTDASQELGMGHLTRCLTLAGALERVGAACYFITRSSDEMIEAVRAGGYRVCRLGPPIAEPLKESAELEHRDAEAVRPILARAPPSLLIVDHYSLAKYWESALRPFARRIMVLDDLANRAHECDLLVDPNLGRTFADYRRHVPAYCEILAGVEFAPLRTEFRTWREYSLRRRAPRPVQHLFVSMGGVDGSNATGRVLEALDGDSLPPDGRISIVLGARAPWISAVRRQAERMPWPAEVIVNPGSMAQLMADSDLAVGGAGTTAWERCCLGLPTLATALAENQRAGLDALARAGVVIDLGALTDLGSSLPAALRHVDGERLAEMSAAASRLVDGLGADRVVRRIEDLVHARASNHCSGHSAD